MRIFFPWAVPFHSKDSICRFRKHLILLWRCMKTMAFIWSDSSRFRYTPSRSTWIGSLRVHNYVLCLYFTVANVIYGHCVANRWLLFFFFICIRIEQATRWNGLAFIYASIYASWVHFLFVAFFIFKWGRQNEEKTNRAVGLVIVMNGRHKHEI